MYKITIANGSVSSVIHEADFDSVIRIASGQFAEEVNQIPSFNFTLLPSNPCYNQGLNDRKTFVKILNTKTDEAEFEGVLLYSGKKMTNAGKVYRSCVCEGFLGFLCDSVQPYFHYENYTIVEFLTALLENHNAQTSEDKHIHLGLCDFGSDNTNSKTTAYRNTLEEIKVNLIDRIGGEIRIRRVDGGFVLDFLTQYGVKCNTTIELAKNIQSLEVSSDSTNIVTRLIPLGYQLNPDETAERLTIESVNDGKMYIDDEAAIAKYGIIVGTAEFDDITLPENLKKAGREYLINNNRVKKAYAAQVLDLSLIDSSQQSIRAGNTYRFKNSFIGLDEDLRVMKRTVDIYKPYKPNIEIGDKAERITDIAAKQARLIEYELPKQKLDILASAKATATNIIKAGINGYAVVNDNEICIMDTPDKETATKVWRWNQGGFGYSSTGYDGEYGTAITMDGAIVADFITAGILRGLEIINGDGTFHVLPDGTVQASAIEITGGKINMTTNSEDYDAIYLNYQNLASRLRPEGFAARNTNTKNQAGVQADGIYLCSNYENGLSDQTVFISSAYGNITIKGSISAGGNIRGDSVSAKTVNAETLIYNRNGDWYNLGVTINNIYDRLGALEGR